MAEVPIIHKSRRASAEEKAKELEVIRGLVCGKNIVITGGATGLGYSFVNNFFHHGAKQVGIIDVDDEAGKRAENVVAKSYGNDKIIFINADTSNYSQINDAFKKLSMMMDSIDIVVNNAGILDERRWEKEISVNIGGMINVATLSMNFMGKDKDKNGGVLVNIGQYFDIKRTAQLPIYTATKFAIIGLSQALGSQFHYDKTGVRVIALCPGLTETAMTIDSPNRLLSRVMKADFVKNLEELSIQTPFVVSEGLMTILKSAESGSCWVVDNGKAPFEIITPNYKTLKRRFKNNYPVGVVVGSNEKTRGRPIIDLSDNMKTGLMSCA